MVGLSAPPSGCHHQWRYTSRRACARIFILRELQRGRRRGLYNLPVVRRYEAAGLCSDRGYYSRLALSHRAWRDRLVDSTRWGIKKEKKKKSNKTKAGQEQRGAIDCITEADGSAIVSTPPTERNWTNTTDTTIIDVTSERGWLRDVTST